MLSYHIAKNAEGGGHFIANLVFVVLIIQVIAALAFGSGKIKTKLDLLHWGTYIFPLYRIGDFLVGCYLGFLYVQRESEKQITKIKATVSEICSLLLVIVSHRVFIDGEIFQYSLSYMPSSCLLIYIFSMEKGIITKALNNCKPLIMIGNASAYIFLIHQILFQYLDSAIRHFVGIKMNAWLMSFIVLLLSLLFGFFYGKAKGIVKTVIQNVLNNPEIIIYKVWR